MLRKKIGLGIVGFGKQAQTDIVSALRELQSKVNLRSICDINAQSIKKAQFLFPEAKLYNNTRDFFRESKDIDFVIICLPHYQYVPVVKQALTAKIPIFKEKPLATTLKDASLLCRLSEQYSTPVFVLGQRRFNEGYRQIKKLMRVLKKPYMFSVTYAIPTGVIYRGWRADKRHSGGGVVIDMGYHVIDGLIWLFGLPDRIWCLSSHEGIEGYQYDVEDSASLLIRYKNGLHGVVQLACLSGPRVDNWQIRSQNGMIERTETDVYLRDRQGNILQSYKYQRDPSREVKEAINFYISKPGASNIKEHLEHMAFIEAAYKSQKNQSGVSPKEILKNL